MPTPRYAWYSSAAAPAAEDAMLTRAARSALAERA